ncbi:HAD family hydrolase [Neobacillus muris]|uniref:HAD family hydrolase n=1 Tax=Neobacillus muris TaxID=2941334 RepID=UPI002040FD05|nr:HAD hydrolase-like protein [Neobacillus muris]
MVKTILFDVDGVLLSEEHYFDASALSVWEMLISYNYLGLSPELFKPDYSEFEIKQIRNRVFEEDRILKFQKSRGLNANWDMIYLVFSHQLIHLLAQIKDVENERISQWLQTPITRETLLDIGRILNNYPVKMDFSTFRKDFQGSSAVKQEMLEYLNELANEKLGMKTHAFSKGELWSVCEHVCQEWYVGDEHVLASTGRPSVQTGKQGFLANETTLAPQSEIADLFQYLVHAQYQIGIGTGRPELETIQPFRHLDWLKYFDVKRIVTADDVLAAENCLAEKMSLSKPHPFTYIMAIHKKAISAEECVSLSLPMAGAEQVLIVGDSLADLLAARSLGAKFAAVLTGLSGKAARKEFEEHQADFILDSVIHLKDIV